MNSVIDHQRDTGPFIGEAVLIRMPFAPILDVMRAKILRKFLGQGLINKGRIYYYPLQGVMVVAGQGEWRVKQWKNGQRGTG